MVQTSQSIVAKLLTDAGFKLAPIPSHYGYRISLSDTEYCLTQLGRVSGNVSRHDEMAVCLCLTCNETFAGSDLRDDLIAGLNQFLNSLIKDMNSLKEFMPKEYKLARAAQRYANIVFAQNITINHYSYLASLQNFLLDKANNVIARHREIDMLFVKSAAEKAIEFLRCSQHLWKDSMTFVDMITEADETVFDNVKKSWVIFSSHTFDGTFSTQPPTNMMGAFNWPSRVKDPVVMRAVFDAPDKVSLKSENFSLIAVALPDLIPLPLGAVKISYSGNVAEDTKMLFTLAQVLTQDAWDPCWEEKIKASIVALTPM